MASLSGAVTRCRRSPLCAAAAAAAVSRGNAALPLPLPPAWNLNARMFTCLAPPPHTQAFVQAAAGTFHDHATASTTAGWRPRRRSWRPGQGGGGDRRLTAGAAPSFHTEAKTERTGDGGGGEPSKSASAARKRPRRHRTNWRLPERRRRGDRTAGDTAKGVRAPRPCHLVCSSTPTPRLVRLGWVGRDTPIRLRLPVSFPLCAGRAARAITPTAAPPW